MSNRANKDLLYEQLARIGKALAAPRRIELVDLLGQAPRTVEGLAHQTEISVANTSRHLQVLRAAGLVEAEKDGLYVTYRLASDEVAAFSVQLRRLAESRLADVERVKRRFFASTDDLDAVSGKELLARVRRGEAVLLDVRPADEYDAGHLPGAMAWGLFPLLFASAGLDLLRIGWLAALSSSFAGFAAGATLLGPGTAMVYPTLLAAIGDVAHPRWRASVAGVDARGRGYVVGAMNGRHQLHVWTAMTARVPWPPSRRASVSVPAW